MVPMDVTHQCLNTKPRLQAFHDIGNACGKATFEMLTFSEHFDIQKYGWEGAPLHDPCAIAYLLSGDLAKKSEDLQYALMNRLEFLFN